MILALLSSVNRLARCIVLCTLVCAGILCGSAAGADGPTLSVEIAAPEALRKRLEDNLDIVRWSQRGGLTAGQIEQLFASVTTQAKEVAATEGYFQPQIVPALDKSGQQWKVRLDVKPGEPTRIASVQVEVTGPVTQDPDGQARVERARRVFRLQPGDQFRQADWSAAKARTLRSFTRQRYATAEITESRATIDPAARTASLFVTVDSGPSVSFGRLEVSGLERYPRKLVENLNPIVPGALYDEELLLKYQRRLLATGQFTSALVSASPTRAQAREVPVSVALLEGKARRVELGAGYSTDRGPRIQATYHDNNMLDRAWRLTAGLSIDRLVKEGNIGLAFPRQANGIHYALAAKGRDEYIRGQDVLNWSISGARIYAVEEFESASSLEYLNERSKLRGGTRDTRAALFANQRWLWNDLDDPINPRRGTTFQIQTGGALESLLSSRSFARVHLRGNLLYPMGRQFTLALRGEAGAVIANSRKDIPSAYVFRTGGDTSIRGYGYESLGVAENDAIVGGRYVLVGSAEVIRWLNREWGVAAFVDGGNAWDELEKLDPVFGYGMGVRWRSPIGNISFDLAYGEATHELRVHLNAGVVFR